MLPVALASRSEWQTAHEGVVPPVKSRRPSLVAPAPALGAAAFTSVTCVPSQQPRKQAARSGAADCAALHQPTVMVRAWSRQLLLE